MSPDEHSHPIYHIHSSTAPAYIGYIRFRSYCKFIAAMNEPRKKKKRGNRPPKSVRQAEFAEKNGKPWEPPAESDH